jgi:hypothetical protein
MKKTFTFLMAISIVLGLQAQLLFEENFNYSTERLASQPGDPVSINGHPSTQNALVWYQGPNPAPDGTPSHLIGDYPLYYEGYISSDLGKSVIINDTKIDGQRIDVVRFFEDRADIITTGVLYYAFMLNVTNFRTHSSGAGEANNEWRDIFFTCDGNGYNIGQRWRGRLFIRQEGNNTLEYTISKNTGYEKMDGAQPAAKGSVTLGDTHLFIIKQSLENQTIEVIAIPSTSTIPATEPTSGWINGNPGEGNDFNGAFGVGIRHRWLASSAEVTLGGLRVARTWSEVLGLTNGLSSINVDKDIYASGKTIVTGRQGTARIFNITGQEVISAQVKGQLKTDLNTGIYIVRFTDEAGKTTSAKVIIK